MIIKLKDDEFKKMQTLIEDNYSKNRIAQNNSED